MKKQFKSFKRGQMVKVRFLGRTFIGSYVRLDRRNGESWGYPHEIAFPGKVSLYNRPRLESQMYTDKQVSR
jgi:hypothetical protein